MRKIIASVLLVFFILGCRDENNIAIASHKADSGNHILFLLDKTLSVQQAQAVERRNMAKLQRVIEKASVEKDDRISLYFVHGNTGGAPAFKDNRFSSVPIQKLGNSISEPIKQKLYQDSLASRRTALVQQLEKAFAAKNQSRTNQETDLWATLEVMSYFFADTPSSVDKKVYILSDMLEDVNGANRRNFTRSAPTSKDEAEAWAKEDAATIRAIHKIDPTALRNIYLTVLTPYGSFDDTDFAEVRYYWEALFAEFGITDVQM